jgi:hypothetical protein
VLNKLKSARIWRYRNACQQAMAGVAGGLKHTQAQLICAWVLIRRVEPACKPGSVKDSYSSKACVTTDLQRPTRIQCEPHHGIPIWPCSGWGLPSHELLPVARCALTAPFHPYPSPFSRKRAVYFLLHFPWVHTPQALPGTLLCGARTFLPPPPPRRQQAATAQLTQDQCIAVV